MTNPPNKNDQFDQDLEAIENAMNSMMQGAFSMVFKQLLDSSNGIFEQFPQTTTIIDGNNVTATNSIAEEEFGGSDFKRLANKSKQNRGLPIEPSKIEQPRTEPPPRIEQTNNELLSTAVGSIFNLLLNPEITTQGTRANAGDIVARPHYQKQEEEQEPKSENNGGWSFTSTSQRTIYNQDGTQETIITKKSNGVTETIKQLHYPDGRIEESREQKNSLWNRLFGI